MGSLAVKCCNRLSEEFRDIDFVSFGNPIRDNHICYIFTTASDHKILEIDSIDSTKVNIFATYTGNIYHIDQISDLDDLIPRLWEFEIPRAMACIYLTFNPKDLNQVRTFCIIWNAEYWKYSYKLIVQNEVEIDRIEDLRMAANDRYKSNYVGDVQIPEPEYYFL